MTEVQQRLAHLDEPTDAARTARRWGAVALVMGMAAAAAWATLDSRSMSGVPTASAASAHDPMAAAHAAPVPAVVTAKLRSTPPGAIVQALDGEVLGKTPFDLTRARAEGTMQVRFVLDGHRPLVTRFALDADSVVDGALQPRGDDPVELEAAPPTSRARAPVTRASRSSRSPSAPAATKRDRSGSRAHHVSGVSSTASGRPATERPAKTKVERRIAGGDLLDPFAE